MTPLETLILVPTALEIESLERAGGLHLPGCRVEPCGFGPVAAAALTGRLLHWWKPTRVLLLGCAGTYDEARLSVGQAVLLSHVTLEGVGVGEGAGLRGVGELGFQQWAGDGASAPVVDTIRFTERPELETRALTVCAAAGDTAHAARRKSRHPTAAIEEMEGFGVAFACSLAGVRVGMVRGVSNVVGRRDRASWRLDEAMAAARERAWEILSA